MSQHLHRARVIVVACLLILVSLGSVADSFAKGSKGGSGGTKTVHVKGYTTKKGTYVAPHDRKAPTKHKEASETKAARRAESSAAAASRERDEKGRFKRSSSARSAFMRETGYPDGRPGYVIDHIRPLACGGEDAPSNMQWQTIEAAKQKDRVERVGC